jgi:hypothetical protein
VNGNAEEWNTTNIQSIDARGRREGFKERRGIAEVSRKILDVNDT